MKIASDVEVSIFGWFFEGPNGLSQFSRASDFIKPVLDLHRRMVQEEPDKYRLTPLYTLTAAA